MELKRMVAFIVDSAERFGHQVIQVPEEIASYLERIRSRTAISVRLTGLIRLLGLGSGA